MIRLHLAQISYTPAYFDTSIDWLEEPGLFKEHPNPLGQLRELEAIESFLVDVRSAYINHLTCKVQAIVEWSAKRKCDILVFPDYSIPASILPKFRELARSHSILIVAGSHKVHPGRQHAAVYDNAGFSKAPTPSSACTPVLFPDGSVRGVLKAKKSKWEQITVTEVQQQPLELTCRGITVPFAVLPCIDSLHVETVGHSMDRCAPPQIMLCPALSPTSQPFCKMGDVTALQECLFAFVNAAQFGGSSFSIPDSWTPYLQGTSWNVEQLPAGEEAVFELCVDPNALFAKRGSVRSSPRCNHPTPFPLVYRAHAEWFEGYTKLYDELQGDGCDEDPAFARDWLDSYLTDAPRDLPGLVRHKLRRLAHTILHADSKAWKPDAMEVVLLQESISNPDTLSAVRIREAISLLGKEIVSAPEHLTADLLGCLGSLKEDQSKLPPPPEGASGTQQDRPTATPSLGQRGSPSVALAQAFQNRGQQLDDVRESLRSGNTRVLIICGALGIGKTAFVDLFFQKTLPDWEARWLPIPSRATVPRVVADIAYSLGIPLDADALGQCTHEVFRSKVRRIAERLFANPKCAIVVDDLEQILHGCTGRDFNLLSTFLKEVSSYGQGSGGRLFLLSSSLVPSDWRDLPSVDTMRLAPLRQMFVRRIIEFHMRQSGSLRGESFPDIPQSVLDVVGGHPLAAKLLVEVYRERSGENVASSLTGDMVATQIAERLLRQVTLTDDERTALCRLAIFRLPPQWEELRSFREYAKFEKPLESLAKRCLVDYDGHRFSMHEAVRRYFEGMIARSDVRFALHRKAAAYYRRIVDRSTATRNPDPRILAELVHHLAITGDIATVRDYRLQLVEEIAPAARRVYREERDYEKALSLYRLLAEVVPDDINVAAYVARCYARLDQWNDCDRVFEDTIQLAKRKGDATWWLYRDWGQIKGRYGHYEESEDLLSKAGKTKEYDPSIFAARAYNNWQQDKVDEASELFEKAYKLDRSHGYTLTYYAKFLDFVGQPGRAQKLREELAKQEMEFRAPREFDLDDEDYDL